MQICARCGNPMEDNAPCCPKCGVPNAFVSKQQFNQYIRNRREKKSDFEKEQERLRILYEQQLQYYKEQEREEEKEYHRKKHRNVVLTAVACFFFAAVAAVLITFSGMGGGEESRQTANNSHGADEGKETFGTAVPTKSPEPTASSPSSGSGDIYKQTVMVYIVGSDLESQIGAASLDIEEMEQSGLDPELVNCIVYTGGSYSWSSDISPNKNSIYRIGNGSKELEAVEEQKNMGESSTLTGFMDYCYENYPADKYTLILWDHGAGPVWGYGADSLADNDSLDMMELTSALADCRLCQTDKLETVVFDACLMGSLEVAALLKPYADYLVGSEEVIAGYGLDYRFLKDMSQTGMDGAKVGTNIVEYYYEFYSSYTTSNENTLTCVDLRKIHAVETALDQLFSQVDNGEQHEKRRAERAALYEYGVEGDISYDLVDVGRLAESMEAEFGDSARAVQNAMQNAIVYQRTTGSNAMGLTVYYPYSCPLAAPDSMQIYCQFGFAEQYTKFIGEFSSSEL